MVRMWRDIRKKERKFASTKNELEKIGRLIKDLEVGRVWGDMKRKKMLLDSKIITVSLLS